MRILSAVAVIAVLAGLCAGAYFAAAVVAQRLDDLERPIRPAAT